MRFLILLELFGIFHFFIANGNCDDNSFGTESHVLPREKLSRKKRYLAFPTGTNFVTTITLLKAVQVNEPKNWNLDLEFDMIWPIPSHEKLLEKPLKRRKIFHHTRRHKRDLYNNIERALSSQGLPGKQCMLRTICEARIYLNPPGISLLDDVLRVILSHEDRGQELDKYEIAYEKKMDCDFEYPCPISVFEFLLSYNPGLFS